MVGPRKGNCQERGSINQQQKRAAAGKKRVRAHSASGKDEGAGRSKWSQRSLWTRVRFVFVLLPNKKKKKRLPDDQNEIFSYSILFSSTYIQHLERFVLCQSSLFSLV